MAKFEKPVNEIDFATEKPEILRKEEEYLYKYMQMKPAKKPKRQVEDGDEDAELEEFANKEIEAEMKRMNGGIDESGDEDDFSGEDEESDGQFFSGDDDLQEVELDESQAGESLEEEYGEEMDAASYDEEMPLEESEEEELVEKKKGKGQKKKKKEEKTHYASYEEFAHLLEQ